MAELVINLITQGGGGGATTTGTVGKATGTDDLGAPITKKSSDKQSAARTALVVHQALETGKKIATTVMNDRIATIGVRTGNYVRQAQVQSAVSNATKVGSLAMAYAANVYVGIAATIVEGVSFGIRRNNELRELRFQNLAIDEQRRRVGYNANGGR